MSLELWETLECLITSWAEQMSTHRTTELTAHLPQESWQNITPVLSRYREQTNKSNEGQQADSFFTTKVYLFFSLTPPKKTLKWFIFHLFCFNGFPFGSKRAFILQNIRLVNMQCWTLALGEMHRYPGWASTGCHSNTVIEGASGWRTTVGAA